MTVKEVAEIWLESKKADIKETMFYPEEEGPRCFFHRGRKSRSSVAQSNGFLYVELSENSKKHTPIIFNCILFRRR